MGNQTLRLVAAYAIMGSVGILDAHITSLGRHGV
nr:MAG TPA: hypothetical protein [Caudoviricetes sp.]